MKQTKRLFSAFLAILLMVGLVPLAGIEAAWASVPSGGVLPGAVAATRPNVQIDYNLPAGYRNSMKKPPCSGRLFWCIIGLI